MRGHDANNAASLGVEASSDDSQDDVLGGEDAGDARVFSVGELMRWVLKHNDGCGSVLAHETGCVSDAGAHTNSNCRGASVQQR